MADEKDPILEGLKDLSGKVDGVKSDITKDVDAKVKSIDEKIEGIKTAQDGFVSNEDFQNGIREVKAALQKKSAEAEVKSFRDVISEGLNEKGAELKQVKDRGLNGTTVNLKAAGDENFDFSNFANDSYAQLTTERRGLYENPFAPIWLRSLLPNGTTSASTIYYPQYSGAGDGAAAIWDGTGAIASLAEKPGVNFDITDVTQNVIWIAGVTRVKREMLDDIPWLSGFISRQLTVGRRGLFVAENAQIMSALDSNSVAYDGSNTLLIEQIYEAAFGQLADSYMNGNLIIMNSRDMVNEIVLNKAQSSGLYNLPAGTVATVGGRLTIGGIPVVGLPGTVVPAGVAYVIDKQQTEFVSRMSPEVRFFEQDRDNVVKNLITVRAEERIATLVFDQNAIVKIGTATT